MGLALSNVLNACCRWEQPAGIFCCRDGGLGGRWLPPSRLRRGGGVAGHPDQCPLAKVCHGEALPWPTLRGHVGMKVPAGTILVVREGMD